MVSDRPQSIVGPAAPTTSKPPVTLSSSAHLDPGAYVRGANPITIGDRSLVHPRAHLLSTHAPLMVGDECIVSEKAILGGPLPPSSTDGKEVTEEGSGDENLKKATIIENRVRVDPHAQIHHSATILEGVVIESHASVLPEAVVGKHSKICAGVVIKEGMHVPEWTVVWGNGDRRRTRQEGDPTEEGRLTVMAKEREATTIILKNAAIKASQARREKGR